VRNSKLIKEITLYEKESKPGETINKII